MAVDSDWRRAAVRRSHWSARALALACAGAVALAGNAGAADWRQLVEIGGSAIRGPYELAVADDGSTLIAWVELTAGDPASFGVVRVTARQPRAAFGPWTTLAGGENARALAVASNSQGQVAVVWRAGVASNGHLRVATGTIRDGVGEPTSIPAAGALPATPDFSDTADAGPVAALADDGTLVVGWLARGPRDCGWRVRAVAGSLGGTLAPARTISRGCAHAWTPGVAVDADGNGAIVWNEGALRRCETGVPSRPCTHTIVAAPVRGGRIARAVRVSRRPAAPLPAGIAATRGDTLVVWRDAARMARNRVVRGRVRVATLTVAGRPSRPRAISRTELVLGAPTVAVNASGDALVAWRMVTKAFGGAARYQVAVRRAGGRFAPPETLHREGSVPDNLVAALDAAGNAVIVRCARTDRGRTLMASIRRLGRRFTAGEPIGDPYTRLAPCAWPGSWPVRLGLTERGDVIAALPTTGGPRFGVFERPGPLLP